MWFPHEGVIFSVTCESIVCPACRTRMVPEYLCVEDRDNAIFCRCSVDECCGYGPAMRDEDGGCVHRRGLRRAEASPWYHEVEDFSHARRRQQAPRRAAGI